MGINHASIFLRKIYIITNCYTTAEWQSVTERVAGSESPTEKLFKHKKIATDLGESVWI